MAALSVSISTALLTFVVGAAWASPAQTLTVDGTARDAKGRAMLVADTGEVWTVLGLDAWPAGVSGQQVAVTGVPGSALVLPEATQGPDGAWSQGVAPGSRADKVLEQWNWVRRPPAGAWTVRVTDGDTAAVVLKPVEGVPDEPVAALWEAIGHAQADHDGWARQRSAHTLELVLGGTAGDAGMLLAPGPRADVVRIAIGGLQQ